MINKIGCIEIPVSDMGKAIDFYENILRLRKTYEHPVWTSFDIGGVTFAIAVSGTKGKGEKICKSCALCTLRYAAGKMKLHKETPTATSVIYLVVEDLDRVYEELKRKGVEFISEPKEQSWGGKVAMMLDPGKNILVLSEA